MLNLDQTGLFVSQNWNSFFSTIELLNQKGGLGAPVVVTLLKTKIILRKSENTYQKMILDEVRSSMPSKITWTKQKILLNNGTLFL